MQLVHMEQLRPPSPKLVASPRLRLVDKFRMGREITLLLIIQVSDLEVIKQILDSTSWEILPTGWLKFTYLFLMGSSLNMPQLELQC